MFYRELGKTGIQVSMVGFGGMRFYRTSEEEALATVRRALDLGITLFETGKGYGDGLSERLFGQALRGARQRVVLANKVGVGPEDNADTVRRRLEQSLANEQAGYFDLFSFWGVNRPDMHEALFRPGGPLAGALRAKEEGLVRALGITTHAQPEEIVAFTERHPWDVVTLKYNLLSRRQAETLRVLGERGIGVIVMNPLAGGTVATPGPAVRAMFEAAGRRPAVVGLRYLLAHPGVTSAISGMTSVAEVEENVQAGAVEGPLVAEEERLVAAVQERLKGLGENFCTACGYCQPCPEGVGIPNIFTLWHMLRGYGAEGYPKLEYLKMREQRHWADYRGKSAEHCVECGRCEEKCPNKLPVVADLKRAHEDLTREAEAAGR
jgi:predicted aldo/keto reductase-like oxidoreductase